MAMAQVNPFNLGTTLRPHRPGGSATIIFHNTINMYVYIYDILYVFHVLNLIFEATFHKEIVMALWRRRYFDIFVDR